MNTVIETYKLGSIRVTISESDHPEKLHVECSDGTYHSEFTLRRYEYENYKRHMNQRIKDAYKEQYGEDS